MDYATHRVWCPRCWQSELLDAWEVYDDFAVCPRCGASSESYEVHGPRTQLTLPMIGNIQPKRKPRKGIKRA